MKINEFLIILILKIFFHFFRTLFKRALSQFTLYLRCFIVNIVIIVYICLHSVKSIRFIIFVYRLLTISPEAWNIPTIQLFVPLLDNYERDTLVNEYVTSQVRIINTRECNKRKTESLKKIQKRYFFKYLPTFFTL